jgi:hypothetical protein
MMMRPCFDKCPHPPHAFLPHTYLLLLLLVLNFLKMINNTSSSHHHAIACAFIAKFQIGNLA